MPLNVNLKRSISPTTIGGIDGIELTSESLFTGKEHCMFLPISEADYNAWASGTTHGHIQVLFPHLTADQREFMMSGVTPEEWDQEMSEDEDIDIDSDIDEDDLDEDEDIDEDFLTASAAIDHPDALKTDIDEE